MVQYIFAIDPGNEESGYCIISAMDLSIKECGKIPNEELAFLLESFLFVNPWQTVNVAIEMIASYGMAVGQTVFDTCVWIGRLYQIAETNKAAHIQFIYRKDEKMNLCGSMKAKDSNITQALIDRFAPNESNRGKGTKKNPGWFYGFKKDIWQAYAVGVTYSDLRSGVYNAKR